MKIEQLCTRSVEFRASEGAPGDGHTLEGYAAVFDQDTEINSWEGHFNERIAPGAFKKTLRERKPVMQFDHGRDARTGSVPIGVFDEIREDGKGLFVNARVFDNPVVEPIRQAIEAQAISGMSFKFRVVRDEWRDNAGKIVRGDQLLQLLYGDAGDRGPLQRTIKEVQLSEAGPVVFPAYAGTSVGVRDMTDADRESLAAQYRRTMLVEDDSEERAITEWLAAEQRYNTDYQLWLSAESEYRTSEWLRAESEYVAAQASAKDVTLQENPSASAADSTLAGKSPEDAGRSTTSHRESKWKVPQVERTDVPDAKKEKAMNLEQLKERMGEIAVRLAEMGEEHRDAEFPAEAQTEWDSLEAEAERNDKAIKAIEARSARLAGLATDSRFVERGTPAFVKKPENIFDLDEVRSGASTEDELAKRYRDFGLRAIEAADYAGVTDTQSAQTHVEHLLRTKDDRNSTLAKRLLITGSDIYERAYGKMVMTGNKNSLTLEEHRAVEAAGEISRALATGDSSGGFAVPFQLDPTVILQNSGVINPLRNVATIKTIVGKEYQIVTTAGASVTRSAEGTEVGDNSFTLANKVVRTNRVTGFVPFSIEIELEWNQLRTEITEVLADAKEQEEASSFMLGDGTGVNANGLIATLSGNTVTTGTAATFAAADIYKLDNALAPRYHNANTAFMGNHSTYNQVRQFATTDGHALWERLGGATPSKLLGYDAYEASAIVAANATPTTGTKFLILGDFSKFMIVDRIGMNVELVQNLFASANMRPTGQRGIFAYWMNNSKIINDAAFKVLVAL